MSVGHKRGCCAPAGTPKHRLAGLLRQSVLRRLVGYNDVNDAKQQCRDPAMRWVVGDQAITESAASARQMGGFETRRARRLSGPICGGRGISLAVLRLLSPAVLGERPFSHHYRRRLQLQPLQCGAYLPATRCLLPGCIERWGRLIRRGVL